ncbi:6198_t:CDS:2 [Paraglomus occultum]|uniref:tRNA-uridine aminocarboxypropyltransferase 1 n=1 Tax=Paraglomus occultum TaxID=144539 RepID=A0A9N8VWC3_9GLOM|nr:6198_t:CDS:2 [Paraglomus occultum]
MATENQADTLDPFPALDTSSTLFGTLQTTKVYNPLGSASAPLSTSPFAAFQISPTDILDTITERKPCPTCNRFVKYFCHDCFVVDKACENVMPKLELPIDIDVIKHPGERSGKSTAIHARLISPTSVSVYPSTSIPAYSDPSRILLLYPAPDAQTLDTIPLDSFDKLVVIDGTWKQAISILKYTTALSSFRKVTLHPRKTMFWRYQNRSENYLATIEAIYYFLVEYREKDKGEYNGEFDNLLWWYKYFYELIQGVYRGDPEGKRFNSRHRKDYITYE